MRLVRDRRQMSEDVGDNVEELVFIPRAMGNLGKALEGASDGYVCL